MSRQKSYDRFVKIDLNHCPNIETLISELYPCTIPGFKKIWFDIDLNTSSLIYPEFLAVIIACIENLKYHGFQVNGLIHQPHEESKKRYVSRINFYHLLNIEYKEKFNRRSSHGKFLEITKFNEENSYQICGDLIKIINSNCSIDRTVLAMLSICMNEIMDNVLTHANSPIGGIIIVQNYKNIGEIRIAIIDSGIGIHQSMIANEKFSVLTEKDSINLVFQEGITSKTGMGNGLFFTKKFIQANQGTLKLFSGEHYIHINKSSSNVKQLYSWPGVVLYMNIKTNNFVNLEQVHHQYSSALNDLDFVLEDNDETPW